MMIQKQLIIQEEKKIQVKNPLLKRKAIIQKQTNQIKALILPIIQKRLKRLNILKF